MLQKNIVRIFSRFFICRTLFCFSFIHFKHLWYYIIKGDSIKKFSKIEYFFIVLTKGCSSTKERTSMPPPNTRNCFSWYCLKPTLSKFFAASGNAVVKYLASQAHCARTCPIFDKSNFYLLSQQLFILFILWIKMIKVRIFCWKYVGLSKMASKAHCPQTRAHVFIFCLLFFRFAAEWSVKSTIWLTGVTDK